MSRTGFVVQCHNVIVVCAACLLCTCAFTSVDFWCCFAICRSLCWCVRVLPLSSYMYHACLPLASHACMIRALFSYRTYLPYMFWSAHGLLSKRVVFRSLLSSCQLVPCSPSLAYRDNNPYSRLTVAFFLCWLMREFHNIMQISICSHFKKNV